MHRLTPEREKEIRDQLITARDINLSDYASFFCSMDIKSLLLEIDALRDEFSKAQAFGEIKYNRNKKLMQERDALRAELDEAVTEFCKKITSMQKERDAALVRVKKLRKAKE